MEIELKHERADRQMCVSLTEELFNEVESFAKEHKVKRSRAVRYILSLYFNGKYGKSVHRKAGRNDR